MLDTTQCWHIQELLRKGEAWTRKSWRTHPKVNDSVRLIVIRMYFGKGMAEEQEQFFQVWNNKPGEPYLNMCRYVPCDEDWQATDWIQVDPDTGVSTGYVLPEMPSKVQLPEEAMLSIFNRQ